MSIFHILNANAHRSPDEIARKVRTGNFPFHPCGEITEKYWREIGIQGKAICYFRWKENPLWNRDSNVENVPSTIAEGFLSTTNSLDEWAFIDYDLRMEVDPFAIDWEKYVEEYRNHVVSQ